MLLSKCTLKNIYNTPQIFSGMLKIAPKALHFLKFIGPSPSTSEEIDEQTGKLNYDNDETVYCDTNKDPQYSVCYFHGSSSTFLLFQIPETLNSDTHQFVKTSAPFTYGGQHGIWYALGFCSLSCGKSK